MNCKKCGKVMKDGAAFCGHCGAPVEAPSQYDRGAAPSQYDREPAVKPVETPQKKAPAQKKKKWPTVLLVLCLAFTIFQVVSSIVEEKQREDYLASIPSFTPAPSMEPVTFPSPFWEEDTTETTQITPAPSAYVPEQVIVSSTPVEVPAATTAPTPAPAQDPLTTGVWVLYSPQTTDAESYVFYEDGTVDVFYHSVMDGTGDRAYEYSGTYSRSGDQVHISAGDIETDARFESESDKLWFETYNGPVEITCYMQQYPDFPDYDTLIADGDKFRQSVG